MNAAGGLLTRSRLQSVLLERFTRFGLAIVGTGVWLSGALWLVFHHWVGVEGEFGPRPSPWEPWWLTLHGGFAFGAIWLFGLLWGVHVLTAWPLSRRRVSGGLMVGTLIWLTATGYFLYYAGNETTRSVLAALHWGIGLGAPVLYVVHRWHAPNRRARKAL